jgi:lipopolysaccharide biosynthesis protein
VAEVREEQARLARENGIYGFCYYHYWFNGRRILERPFEEVFHSKKPDFPFMLCWANENWTRTWDGQDKHILLDQKYSEADDRNHIQSLIEYFKDPRYIRVNNKPVLSIYKSSLLPDAKKTISIWREEAAKHGMELYLCRFDSFGNYGISYLQAGFDAAIEFQPFSRELDGYFQQYFERKASSNLLFKLKRKCYQLLGQDANEKKITDAYRTLLYRNIDYNNFVDYILHNYKFEKESVKFPGATPSWDNSARKGEKGFLLHNSNPQKFQEWLTYLKANYTPASEDENFIFINAWNEWAEGNHLEPCVKWGSKYLEAMRHVFSK